ncbi:MAG: hypothetical protein E7604_03875 [Ruminococcaceae bacterium]|nr:hypothetical protein [Oscillospiraceae bacterium]
MAQDQENMQNEGLEQKLNSILSDPESLSRLAAMASSLASSGMLSGLMQGSGTAEEPSKDNESVVESTEGDREAAAKPLLQNTAAIRGISGRHSALLRAIKPYLGTEKQTRIDQMMKLLQLAELADTVLRGM